MFDNLFGCGNESIILLLFLLLFLFGGFDWLGFGGDEGLLIFFIVLLLLFSY